MITVHILAIKRLEESEPINTNRYATDTAPVECLGSLITSALLHMFDIYVESTLSLKQTTGLGQIGRCQNADRCC